MIRQIKDQTVVIAGASSGIGRLTALEFGRRGAKVALASRNEAALQEVAAEIKQAGGQALPLTTDIADPQQVRRLAEEAVRRFGRIDTWINNAGVSVYATFDQLTEDEMRRIIEVNLLGHMYGTRAALDAMRGQAGGGTIINVASGLGVRAVPLQAVYCASKFGLRGFTEAVRMEQDHARTGINLTLILPASINTPFFNHARSKTGKKPMPIPPVYEPELVAEAILYAAEHPSRDIYVGGAGRALSLLEKLSPRLTDWLMTRGGAAFRLQKTNDPDDERDNLFEPLPEKGRIKGDFGLLATTSSPYTRLLELHPERKRVLRVVGLAALLAYLRRAGR